MADTTLATLNGIYSRLSGFTALTDIVSTRIYSDVPQQTAFPYVYFSLENSEDYSTKNRSDYMHKLRVQIFSRDTDQAEALNIRKAVFDALDRQEVNITISGATLVRIQKDNFAAIFKENDGTTWQAAIQFDVVVQGS